MLAVLSLPSWNEAHPNVVTLSELTVLLPVCFALSYVIGMVLLILTAHNGARLVHTLGIQGSEYLRALGQGE